MTLGMLVRADHRGLATMTAIMARCLKPERVLLVDMGKHSVTACHPDEYPERWSTVAYDELLAGTYDWAPFLDGLDCVYTAETPYDFRLFSEAARLGVKTVLHVMPELDPYVRQPDLPRPDVLALPTDWMASSYGYHDAPVLPVPVKPFVPDLSGNLVAHPAALAMRDRNGTRIVIEASKHTRYGTVVIRSQVPLDLPHGRARVEVADLPETRDLYDGAALVVIPRRYGGLSLVIQEALAAGLPLLVGEHDPYAAAVPPEARLGSIRARDLQAKGGNIQTWDVSPRTLAAKIDEVMCDTKLRAQLVKAARVWRREHTWKQVRPAWDAVLGTTVPV